MVETSSLRKVDWSFYTLFEYVSAGRTCSPWTMLKSTCYLHCTPSILIEYTSSVRLTKLLPSAPISTAPGFYIISLTRASQSSHMPSAP